MITTIEELENLDFKDLQKLNEYLLDNSNFDFPFVDLKKKIQIKKGIYRRKKALFRGFSFRYNKLTREYRCTLMGYYFVPEDISYNPALGNKDVFRLKVFDAPADSKVYQLAKDQHTKIKNQKIEARNDKFNNNPR